MEKRFLSITAMNGQKYVFCCALLFYCRKILLLNFITRRNRFSDNEFRNLKFKFAISLNLLRHFIHVLALLRWRMFEFTISLQEYMASEGIILNEPEGSPDDPYTESRKQPIRAYKTPSTFDKLRQFIELDRQVLRFYSLWDDRDSTFGELRPVVSMNVSFIMLTEEICPPFNEISSQMPL